VAHVWEKRGYDERTGDGRMQALAHPEVSVGREVRPQELGGYSRAAPASSLEHFRKKSRVKRVE